MNVCVVVLVARETQVEAGSSHLVKMFPRLPILLETIFLVMSRVSSRTIISRLDGSATGYYS